MVAILLLEAIKPTPKEHENKPHAYLATRKKQKKKEKRKKKRICNSEYYASTPEKAEFPKVRQHLRLFGACFRSYRLSSGRVVMFIVIAPMEMAYRIPNPNRPIEFLKEIISICVEIRDNV